MPSARRPAINAPITVCTRTLTDNQDVAAQVATPHPRTITSAAGRDVIAHWASALELEILIAFKIDPKRYKVRLHDLTPTDQPCPEGKEVRSLNYLDLSDAKPIVNGPYEVHFILREHIPTPTAQDLRKWQSRWEAISADAAPQPAKTTVTFCEPDRRPMRVDIASLSRPFACDLHSAIRGKLGLMSEKELFQANFGKVFGVNLGRDEVLFHLNSESCEERRDVDELRTGVFDGTQPIKVHVRSGEGSVPGIARRNSAPGPGGKKRKRVREQESERIEP